MEATIGDKDGRSVGGGGRVGIKITVLRVNSSSRIRSQNASFSIFAKSSVAASEPSVFPEVISMKMSARITKAGTVEQYIVDELHGFSPHFVHRCIL